LAKNSLLLEKEKFFIIDKNSQSLISFGNIFGNDRPIILEIGAGKGEFIAMYSRFHPEYNFVGIELRSKRIVSILKKLDIKKNSNARLLNLFVDTHITEKIPENSIFQIVINHPDPWPKSRHQKHRLIQPEFLEALCSILMPGGFVKISTDDFQYVKWIVRIFGQCSSFKAIYSEGYSYAVPEDHIKTYFDDLLSAQGHAPAFMLYKYTPQSSMTQR
jgi:tRNA (guanine-N7-)-methyltransferase